MATKEPRLDWDPPKANWKIKVIVFMAAVVFTMGLQFWGTLLCGLILLVALDFQVLPTLLLTFLFAVLLPVSQILVANAAESDDGEVITKFKIIR